MKVKKKVTLKKFIAGQLMHDKVGKIGTRSWLLRLGLWERCQIDGYINQIRTYSRNRLIGKWKLIANQN